MACVGEAATHMLAQPYYCGRTLRALSDTRYDCVEYMIVYQHVNEVAYHIFTRGNFHFYNYLTFLAVFLSVNVGAIERNWGNYVEFCMRSVG